MTLEKPALFTDLYQLTMLKAHVELGRADKKAVFEYFFRKLPPHTGYAVFAGLGTFLSALERMRFGQDELAFLKKIGIATGKAMEYLKSFSFEGNIWAVPEGSVVFPYEPLVRVEAPIAQAQLIETLLLNILNYQTLIATKASRICEAAEGDPVVEFGLRRAQGPDGGLSGSRAAYIGGCAATSNVAAAKEFDIPVKGTHAHSWVMSFPSEEEAFRAYAKAFPDTGMFLVDTYDVVASGVPNAIKVLKEMRAAGWNGRPGIRIDSGDMAKLSKQAHEMLLRAGFEDPVIMASNDLDEDLVADMKRQGAKINCWGIGTKLITGGEFSALGGVYKLVEIEDGGQMAPKMKISGNIEKTTDPAAKTICRFGKQKELSGDILCLLSEKRPGDPARSAPVMGFCRNSFYGREISCTRWEWLLREVVRKGKRIETASPGHAAEERRRSLASLPPECRRLRNPETYPVLLSKSLAETKKMMMKGTVTSQ
jgi:nicotinate phosphoribosyltransferase